MKTRPPKIDERAFSDLMSNIRGIIPHYTPEWTGSDEKDPGVALLKIFTHINESIIHRFNQVPHKNFVAFLDMLGIQLLPAQPARVPLTFYLSKGTDKEILIPAGTQASSKKTDEHEKLIFETEKNLLATPSLLKRVVSTDPEKDAIYIPPPGFLDGSQQEERSYTIVSSPSAGSKDFQLDHITDLEEGDFLRIGNETNIEYGIVSGISGTIIKMEDTLLCAHPASTPVEKITKFNLFEGKNMQEHSFYIGHEDLFNIKSTAHFILSITHREGTQSGIDPLKVSWEYWGEVEGEEEEGWLKFNTIDLTRGFSKDGEIHLNKMQEGEIKEKEINDIKSRWIRCILDVPLPVDEPRILPRLDTITFIVKSSGEKILPDLAFNNDTPLDISLPFTPVGKEPRMFDNFSIASKEAFSKKGGKIEIEADVEQRGILGPPTAISNGGKIKVFARGTYGRLVEVEIDPNGEAEWKDHGFPPDTKIAAESAPSAVHYPLNSGGYLEYVDINGFKERNISVFMRAENGHLVEWFDNGSQGQWIDYGTPEEGINIQFDPAAIYHQTERPDGYSIISIFSAGTDCCLYELNRRPDEIKGKWINRGKPVKENISVNIDSSPYADSYEDNGYNYEGIRVKVLVKGKDGILYELDCKAGEEECTSWEDYPSVPTEELLDSRPFFIIYRSFGSTEIHYYVKVFIKDLSGNLWEFDTKDNWTNLGSPESSINSAPHGYLSNPPDLYNPDNENGKHIFVRDQDNLLWVRNDFGWVSHEAPANSGLKFDPYVLSSTNTLHIFSASDKNAIVERRIGLVRLEGTATGGTDNTINLNGNASSTNGAYNGMIVKIINGPGSDQIRKIIEYDGVNKTATVDNWDTIPESDSNYLLIGYTSMIWNEYKDPLETALTPTLSWEYWNSKGWVVLKGLKDETSHLLNSGKITFSLPEDIEETEIAGQKSFWIRGRIVGGDYGRESFSLLKEETNEQKLIFSKDSIRPPIINKLTISYVLETEQYPQQCKTYNNLEYIDQTDANKIEDKQYSPFVKLEDRDKTLYLGFKKYFKDGPVKIFFLAKELSFTEEQKPKMEWTYSKKNDWGELDYYDASESLIMAEILELLGPSDFSARTWFGSYLYWIKGSLTKGEYEEWPLLDGIYPNTTWALQAETIKDETIGSSNGEPDQTFEFLKIPVLNGVTLRIQEILSEEEKLSLTTASGEDAIHEVKDEKGNIIETWVLWSEVLDFFDSKENDRHYTLDRATGQIQFGDGINGMIPQAGENNIRAFSYRWGGGKQGNVRAGDIKSIKSPVSGVDSVLNPAPADGGADTVTLDRMLEIGPARISHRNRAVTVEDFEWLAMEASRKLAKVRCLPNTNNRMEKETGWVSVIIVPDSPEDEPSPSLELKRKVRKYLEEHCANTISFPDHIHVTGPSYVKVGISVDVFIISIDAAGEVEREVNKKLRVFFHPLTGGPEGNGWDFGRDVSVSDVYALIEKIKGVDHVENLKFAFNGTKDGNIVNVEPESLAANGTHTVNLQLVKGGQNL